MNAHAAHALLVKIQLLLDDGDNRLLQQYDLNRTQYLTLQLLDAQQGQRLVDLATALLCERSTVTRIVDRLEQEGLAHRQSDDADRRSQRVVLTQKGLDVRDTVRQQYEQSLHQRLGALNAEELAQLVPLLNKLQIGLSESLVQKR